MKSGENFNFFSRRKFLKLSIATGILTYFTPIVVACKNETLKFVFKITGANHILAHKLWTKNFPKASQTIEIPVLIIGAGVTGLSAGRQFIKKGFDDFLLLELEEKIGGNSAFGENKYSKFPIAAHYLPLPNPDDKELIGFLEESKVIIGFNNNIPIFDEEQLCADPHERLFIRNNWQEDLIPKYGNSEETEKDFERFFNLMRNIRSKKGNDNKYFFDIPIKNCSKDNDYKILDTLTMKDWLIENQFKSEELFEYINYCCRDDFGLGIEAVSAWAGVFYFCARKNQIYGNDSVLTWPEGNGKLVTHLSSVISDKIKKEILVFDVSETKSGVEILAYDSKEQKTIRFKTEKVICTSPQFVNGYLFESRNEISKIFEYAPWFTATITLRDCFYNDNFPLSWDNVVYKSKGLGYVYNQHQNVNQIQNKKVITYYYSFESSEIKVNRKKLFKMSEDEFKALIINDLKIPHPSIEEDILDIEIYKLGHGMISPKPNFMFHQTKEFASKSINNKIYFAHSDLSGISIFEEAFHRGIDVVNTIMNEKILDI